MAITASMAGRTEQGLTLFELLTVMAIIAIIGGFGFGGLFAWIGDDHVKTTSQALQSQVQTAIAYALQNPQAPTGTNVSPNGDWSVVNDTTHHQLLVCPGSTATPCATSSTTSAAVRVTAIPNTSVITLNGAPFTCLAFTDHGLPDPANSGCAPVAAASGHWDFTIQDVSQAVGHYVL